METLTGFRNATFRETIETMAGRIFNRSNDMQELTYVGFGGHLESGQTVSPNLENIHDISQLEDLNKDCPRTRLFTIGQHRSWSNLNISRTMFEAFIQSHDVFNHIWRLMMVLGITTENNEQSFPGFKWQQMTQGSYEIAYIVRRVEFTNRLQERSPWSIRQSGVYQNFQNCNSRLMSGMTDVPVLGPTFESLSLVIAPSSATKLILANIENMVSFMEEIDSNPWNLHIALVEEGLSNWPDYMAWIETELRQLLNKAVLTDTGSVSDTMVGESASIAPGIDIKISFNDRQKLQDLEDYITDLNAMFSLSRRNVMGLMKVCAISCKAHQHISIGLCQCDDKIAAMGEQISQIDALLECTVNLRERARSVRKMLSDLLNYEDNKALVLLAEQSHLESQAMHELTKKSTTDAAAMKALTVISLIYLPTTIVANFFSTEFIKTNDNGGIEISRSTWLLAAISVPLTLFTIALWILWQYCTKTPDQYQLPLYHGPDRGSGDGKVELRRRTTEPILSKVRNWTMSPEPT
ncbi:hypothetical protein EJ05DRAFT_500092 [Pseudovirgaria hyperparasitica]|uniref:CorA-like transporter domain-containing protein n=1 Tax=Pseudovirgaria hyperparasitica TaxID=470096 RepID=A0A6A6W7Q8_9PEZI|nr:uncharacterized protein EJ05DRAFT_500092 [Pseudovirgaria hyperparasitica]KAF2758575.1 hypothetical protein EJ05DRAFT_500092 [Pseudovirgaria hyperparasitica]